MFLLALKHVQDTCLYRREHGWLLLFLSFFLPWVGEGAWGREKWRCPDVFADLALWWNGFVHLGPGRYEQYPLRVLSRDVWRISSWFFGCGQYVFLWLLTAFGSLAHTDLTLLQSSCLENKIASWTLALFAAVGPGERLTHLLPWDSGSVALPAQAVSPSLSCLLDHLYHFLDFPQVDQTQLPCFPNSNLHILNSVNGPIEAPQFSAWVEGGWAPQPSLRCRCVCGVALSMRLSTPFVLCKETLLTNSFYAPFITSVWDDRSKIPATSSQIVALKISTRGTVLH